MNKKVHLTIYPFGVFRTLIKDPPLALSVPYRSSLNEFRLLFEKALDLQPHHSHVQELIRLSAFSDDKKILDEHFEFLSDMQLFILPPVCGG
ncbi:MAG TPA: hypothetical protein VJ205_03290 [Gammaproteobacteria bacterium]|nr:hypothetical protein [Gammaproteobacteria bacterium]